jgi:hypothetical protein
MIIIINPIPRAKAIAIRDNNCPDVPRALTVRRGNVFLISMRREAITQKYTVVSGIYLCQSRQFFEELFTCSKDTSMTYSLASSMDMQHGHSLWMAMRKMDIEYVHAVATQHGHEARTCSTHLQHGHAACTCSMEIQREQQRVHAA